MCPFGMRGETIVGGANFLPEIPPADHSRDACRTDVGVGGCLFFGSTFRLQQQQFFFGFPLAVHRVAGASPIDSCTQIDIERLQSIAWPTHQQPTMDSRSMFRFHVDGFGLVIFSIAGNSIALVERSVSRFVRERECVKPFLLLSKRIFFSLLGFWSRDGQAAII